MTLMGMPVPMLTITEDIETYLTYSEQLALQTKL